MRKSKTTTKLACFAGATALVALSPQAQAQSADALIDKLVDKGILTVDEAKDLRDEADKNFNTAFQAKTGMPDWVTGYKISGSVRGRYEQFSGDNQAMIDRTRLRYRLLFGVSVNMLDNMEAGFRLGSGDAKGSGGNPLSQSSTFTGNWSDKNIYVDAAYGKWTPINSGGWLLSTTVGKMENPFNFTYMVFDPDLTPEGAVLQGGYTFNDKQNIACTGGAFVLQEVSASTHDPFLWGGQIQWNSKWTEKWSSSLGLGAFAIVSPEQLTAANALSINQGNTRYQYNQAVPGGSTTVTALRYGYTPIIADASVTYTLETFPLYTGTFPIKLSGEAMHNPSAPKDNNGYWVGVTFGKSGTKKTWDISYRYEYLGADAWYDQLTDDDNGAYYVPDNLGSSTSFYNGNHIASSGWYGGTNVKGHLVKFNYSFTDSLTFTVSAYLSDLITLPNQTVPAVNLNSTAIHMMADLMWKF
ncbi:MAG: putative porin [Verrucomicrobiota bacterium]